MADWSGRALYDMLPSLRARIVLHVEADAAPQADGLQVDTLTELSPAGLVMTQPTAANRFLMDASTEAMPYLRSRTAARASLTLPDVTVGQNPRSLTLAAATRGVGGHQTLRAYRGSYDGTAAPYVYAGPAAAQLGDLAGATLSTSETTFVPASPGANVALVTISATGNPPAIYQDYPRVVQPANYNVQGSLGDLTTADAWSIALDTESPTVAGGFGVFAILLWTRVLARTELDAVAAYLKAKYVV